MAGLKRNEKERKMNTKGIGVGQVFVFIIAAISFALIMIFGYKAITDFAAKGKNVQFFQFKTDLENSIKRIYTEYGAVQIETFHPPLDYKQICFVDFDSPYNKQLCEFDQIACSAWETTPSYEAADANIFLTLPAPTQIKSEARIKMEHGFLCLPIVDGSFKVAMEGKGDHTYLSKP